MPDAKSPDTSPVSIKTFSRRDFLKLGVAGLAGVFLAKKTGAIDYAASVFDPESEKVLIPEVVHGVEVYGLGHEIKTDYHAGLLYEDFDKKFDAKLSPDLFQKSRSEQRESVLERDKRYLEVVVTKSTYESFLARKVETSVDLVEWLQIHVDLMNRTAKKAKPPADIETQLLRVVVVDDNFDKNPSKHSKDMDATWFINEDYRNPNQPGDYFLTVYQDQNGDIEIRRPQGFENGNFNKWTFSRGNDSLTGKNNILIDFGLIHEWSHMAWDLPDQFWMNADNSPFKQSTFRFETGNYVVPDLGPYLSYMVMYNVREGRRGAFTDPDRKLFAEDYKKYCFNQLPQYSTVTTNNNDEGISVWFPKLKNGANDFDQPYGFDGKDGKVVIQDDQMRVMYDGVTYTHGAVVIRSGEKEIYLPTAVFNMSKVVGENTPRYYIEFENNPYDIDSKTQIVKLVDASDLVEFEQDQGKSVFAKMAIPGTQTWCFWFLEK